MRHHPDFEPFVDESLCVVHNRGTLEPPKLYIAVDHNGHDDICDACDLKGRCSELFGPRGEGCMIHSRGDRWQQIETRQWVTLRALLPAEPPS